MTATDLTILREFAERVRVLDPTVRLWAFGSRARGDADADSDFDICVLVSRSTSELSHAIRKAAWEVGFERERVIAPVILEQEDFESGPMSASSLVARIHAEGVAA